MKIQVKELKEFTKEHLVLIGYSKDCVTQIVSKLPSEAVLRQSCYLFFKIINDEKRKIKINNPALLFLILISGETQLNDAINKIGAKEGSVAYLITCCEGGDDKYSNINKLNKEERLILTKNAITFI